MFLLNAMISGIIAGVLVGLIPFFMGRSKNQEKLGLYSLFACGLSGSILGLVLAIPVACGCCFCIYNRDVNQMACPHCKEYIKKDAIVCKHCKKEIQKSLDNTTESN